MFQGKRSQLEWVSHPPLPTASAILGDFIKPGKTTYTGVKLKPSLGCLKFGSENLWTRSIAGWTQSVGIPLGKALFGAFRCRKALIWREGVRAKLMFLGPSVRRGGPPSSAHFQLLCPGPHPFCWKWPWAGRGCIVWCLLENQPQNKNEGML